MAKHRSNFVNYVRNGAVIPALVVFAREVYTPATQTTEAKSEVHLTVVYLDPEAAGGNVLTGEQLRSSVKTQFDVPPLAEGAVNGWLELPQNPPEIGGVPSAEDLDAAAAEQAAKEATAAA